MLTPARRRGIELIDDPGLEPHRLCRSMRDVVRANALFGGRRAVRTELQRFFEGRKGASLVMLDVGTGLGDLPAQARRLAAVYGVQLRTVGVDRSAVLAREARSAELPTVRADALRLPVRDDSVDVVLCSQLLHHFEGAGALALIRELTRVTRSLVLVAELRRSWTAAALFWLASWPLRFEAVTRHDGTLSVMRGFTAEELIELVAAAVGRPATVTRHAGFRLSATWTPGGTR